ncbi:MAG: hypothetical protein RL685_4098 [Pseudomonadota bacterium]|jgi:ATP-binding cassette subfamily B protein
MSRDVMSLSWPEPALSRALAELGGVLRNVPAASLAPAAPAALDDEALGDWLSSAAAHWGLQCQHVQAHGAELDALVRRLGPALVRLPGAAGADARYLAVLRSGGRRSELITPAGRAFIPHRVLVGWLGAELERVVGAPLASCLQLLGVSGHRARRARAGLLLLLLEQRRITGIYLLVEDAGASFALQLRQQRLPRRAAAVLTLCALQVAVGVAGWALLGSSALLGHVDPGLTQAWLLTQLAAVPLQLGVSQQGGTLLRELAVLLKRRLLCGAFRIDPELLAARGAGRLLAMVFESSAIESAGLAGVFGLAVAGIQLLSAFLVLALGASGTLLGLLLAGWCAALALLLRGYIRRRRHWTRERFGLARSFVEAVVGHRTRIAQQPARRWHEREDPDLARHVVVSADLDHWQTLLLTLPARGWLLLGLGGLVGGLLFSEASVLEAAIAVAGVLQAYTALGAATGAALGISSAAVAWAEVSQLFQAARGVPPGSAALALLPSAAPTSQDLPVATLCGVSFRYPQARASALHDCELSLHAGERALLEGPSGAGKSTLAALLTGLRAPDCGQILLGGLDRATLGEAGWRRRVTSVPQFHENHILSAPLSFNLLMGRRWPATAEDLAEARQVCESLGLGPLLRRMPAGISQIIGETGWQLSHGERSRLFLARALLQRSELLVVDESFGALDAETLQQCMRCVRERARTLLVIAHP